MNLKNGTPCSPPCVPSRRWMRWTSRDVSGSASCAAASKCCGWVCGASLRFSLRFWLASASIGLRVFLALGGRLSGPSMKSATGMRHVCLAAIRPTTVQPAACASSSARRRRCRRPSAVAPSSSSPPPTAFGASLAATRARKPIVSNAETPRLAERVTSLSVLPSRFIVRPSMTASVGRLTLPKSSLFTSTSLTIVPALTVFALACRSAGQSRPIARRRTLGLLLLLAELTLQVRALLDRLLRSQTVLRRARAHLRVQVLAVGLRRLRGASALHGRHLGGSARAVERVERASRRVVGVDAANERAASATAQ